MTEPKRGLPWGRWNRSLHRDLGYFSVGLTLLFTISGVALNHTGDWNPSYRVVRETRELGPFDPKLEDAALATEALRRLGIAEKPKSALQPEEDTLQIFLKERSIRIRLSTGQALVDGKQPRPVLYALNRLHLNAPKGLWTWMADAYALLLSFLALSGLFILKGRNGLKGRGLWLTLAGLALPAGFWIWFSLR